MELPPIIDTACVISKNASGEFSAWCALRNFPYRGTEWTLVSSFRKKGAKLGANKKEAIVKQEADVVWVRVFLKKFFNKRKSIFHDRI